jgi:cytochrome P450
MRPVRYSLAARTATLESVLRALFTLADAGQRQRLADMVRAYMAGPGTPNILDGFSRSEYSWSWAQRGRRAFQRHWFAAVDEIVAGRKAQTATEHPADQLDLLLAARDPETGGRLTDAQVRDQCATMLLAGFETTSQLFVLSNLFVVSPFCRARPVARRGHGIPARKRGNAG